jgi:hypothetical protein
MENKKTNNEADNDAARADAAEDRSGVGDVETAGETTAIAAITGPNETSPVGAETMVKVADAPSATESDNEEHE